MFVRLLTVALGLSLIVNAGMAEEPATISPGQTVGVELTGQVAKEFTRLCGRERNADVKKVETSGTIVQKMDNGKFRLIISQTVVTDDKSERIVTVMAMVDAAQLITRVTPKDTPVSAQPIDLKKPVPITLVSRETKWTTVKLSELKGVKLRAWKITEEVGE